MSAMYTVGEQTWFTGIKSLLPGHYMLVNPRRPHRSPWWDLPDHRRRPGAHPERYYIDKTRELLENSVRLRLRSDVLSALISAAASTAAP